MPNPEKKATSETEAKPEKTATPEQKARRVARNSFKSARTAWVDAKARLDQIKAQIETGTLPDTEKKALHAEMKDLRAKLPTMAETVRTTKAAWMELKGEAKGPTSESS